jgi:hypothetical protein
MRRLTGIKMPEQLICFLVNRLNVTLFDSLCIPHLLCQRQAIKIDRSPGSCPGKYPQNPFLTSKL